MSKSTERELILDFESASTGFRCAQAAARAVSQSIYRLECACELSPEGSRILYALLDDARRRVDLANECLMAATYAITVER